MASLQKDFVALKPQPNLAAGPMREHGIINPKKIAHDLALIAALLIMLNIGAELVRMGIGDQYIELIRVIMLDSEKNIPTYFSSVLLSAAGFILPAIATKSTQ